MKLSPVSSSQISHIGHCPETNRMVIQFARGGTRYIYENVTAAQHEALVGATSVGSHFHTNFRNNPDFPYSRHDAELHGPVEIEGEA
jgi:hypothetical protein